MTNILLSVIIPTCNRNEMLTKCLQQLQPAVQKLHADQYELIVTDDSMGNVSKSLIEQHFPFVRWVEGVKQGPAANRNNGVRYAKGNWLVFIDDDCLPDNNVLQQYIDAISKDPQSLAFEGCILPDDWSLLKKDMAECPINIEGGCFWTANVCINKDIFEKAGKFDEDFKIAAQEDQLLYEKLKKITNVMFVPAAKVIHPVRLASFAKTIKNNYRSLHNWLIYMQKSGIPFFTAIKTGFFFQIINLKRNIVLLKARKSLINIYTIFIGLPILIITHATSKSRQKV